MATISGKPAPLHLPVYQVNEPTFNIPAPLGFVFGYGGGNYQLPPLHGIVSGAMLYVNNYGADLVLHAAEDNTITFYDPDTGTHVLDQVTVKAGSCAQYTTDFVGTWYQLGYQTPVVPPAPPSDSIAPVRAATVRALGAESWASAVVFGAGTITVTTTGTPIIDDVTLALNDRVLIRNNSPNNGIYSVTALSAGLLQFTITDDTVVQTSIASVSGGTTNLQQRFALYGTEWIVTGLVGSVAGLGNNVAALNTAGNLVFGNTVTSAVTNSMLFGNLSGVGATGSGNQLIGPSAGSGIVGNNNMCYGSFAGINATSSSSMFFGERAGVGSSGNTKVCFGPFAGSSSMSTDMCAFGRESGILSVGRFGAYLGRRAGNNSNGDYQTHLGSYTGNGVLGDYAICSGFDAGSGSLSDNLVAIGRRAGYQHFGTVSTFVGAMAGNISSGEQLVGCGNSALEGFSGEYGIGVGLYSLGGATGFGLLGLGVEAGATSIGDDNVFVGYVCGSASTGNQMTCVGNFNANSCVLANNLTSVGFNSALFCFGENNNIFGANTGSEITGSNNCIFGNNLNLFTADYNILIGNNCCAPTGLGDTNIVIGRNNVPQTGINLVQIGSGLSCDSNGLRSVQIGTNLTIISTNTKVVQLGYNNSCRSDCVQLGADNLSSVTSTITLGIGNSADTINGIAVGFAARATGLNSIAFGVNSLGSTTAGSNNTAFGSNTGRNLTTGTQNTAFGANALFYNTTGINNCAFGSGALGTNALSTQPPSAYSNNCAYGQNAMCFHFTGDFNVAMGSSALRGALPASIAPANNVNSSNTALGNECMNFVFLSDMNTAVGRDVLKHAGKCTSNVGIGYQTMYCQLAFLSTSNPINNTAVGAAACSPNVLAAAAATFNNNCSFGFNSMSGIAPTLANTCAFGALTLQGVLTDGHCAFGSSALRNLTSGTNCAAYGLNSLVNCSTGSNNCAYGPNTGAGITTQSNAVLFGVGANSTTSTAVAIGNGITNSSANTAAIGNVGTVYVRAAAAGVMVDGDVRCGYYMFGAPISLSAITQTLNGGQFSADQLIIFTGGTATTVDITLPTGATVASRFPGTGVGSSWDITIRNTSTNTLNLSSGDVVAANTVVLYRITITGASAYAVQRVGSMGV